MVRGRISQSPRRGGRGKIEGQIFDGGREAVKGKPRRSKGGQRLATEDARQPSGAVDVAAGERKTRDGSTNGLKAEARKRGLIRPLGARLGTGAESKREKGGANRAKCRLEDFRLEEMIEWHSTTVMEASEDESLIGGISGARLSAGGELGREKGGAD